MLDDKTRAAIDQAKAGAEEIFPPLWYGLYRRCVEEGFTEDQAIRLVKAYIVSMCPFGVRS